MSGKVSFNITNSMRIQVLFIVVSCLFFCGKASAQRDDYILLVAYVNDAATGESLKDARVIVMTTDSVVLDTMLIRPIMKRGNVYRHLGGFPPLASFIYKAVCPGYDTAWVNMPLADVNDRMKQQILLHRSSVQLEGYTVTGSKILMVNRGDTIIYNASALQLSSGSMLDGLIRRLPGVELHPGGRITVNGKFVSSLLVNGRDFFRGDPKIALENLPAYYVDKVRVYNERSLKRRVMEGDSVAADSHDPLVMDVGLKRDYAEGWLANATAGYGTHERYLARLFAMRYTRSTWLFLFGNVNNLNNDQTASRDGGWAGRLSADGTFKARTFGANFSGENKKTLLEYGTSAKLSTTDGDYEDITSADHYYATGDIFQRQRSQSRRKSASFAWDGSVRYPKMQRFLIAFQPSLTFTREDNSGLTRSASFFSDPHDTYRGASIDSLYSPLGSSRLASLLISQREQIIQGKSDELRLAGQFSLSARVGGKWVQADFNGSYADGSRKTYELEHLKQGTASEAVQNRDADSPGASYDYTASLGADVVEKPIRLNLKYSYRQHYTSGERQLYRLDRYEPYRDATGFLPSTTDSLQAAIDIRNSYLTSSLGRVHTLMPQLQWRGWQLMLSLAIASDRLSDRRNGQQQRLSRSKPYFSPEIYYTRIKRGKMRLIAAYQLRTTLPEMSYLLEVRDDADPLRVQLGNPDLRSSMAHTASITYERTGPSPRQRTANVQYRLWTTQRAVSMARHYDTTTGVSTYRPENIDGNWGTRAQLTYGQNIDSQRRMRLTSTTTAAFHHSVDYASLGMQDSRRNTVDNINVGETLKADWRLRDWYVAATAHADWRHATSPAEYFTDVNAWDYNYGLTLTKQLVKNLDLDTEMMMWSRRGYTDATMNDDNLIWNISLSYAFGRLGQWIVRAEGRDILRQQSNVRHTMNAQGRTETWFRTIPSYWMLSLQYQFKKEPKKR